MRGVAIVDSNLSGGGTLALQILSPDLRQDDKPRLDKAFTIPAGATVYRTAITAVNLSAAGTDTVRVDGLTTAHNADTLTAAAGVFPEAGATTAFDGFTTVSAEASGTTITAAYSGALNIVNSDDCAAVIVEVCFYKDGGAPDSDDIHLPYKTEAGQGY